MNKIDEKELKKLFTELKSSNNRIAFETLYTKYNKLVYRIAFTILKNKEDSEDIMQAVFSKIYTLSKDKLPIDNIPTWIYSVTKNESISLFRKKKNTVDIDSVYEIADTDNEINNIIDQDNYNRLISRLNNKEKEIVSLKVLTNLSFDEIAKLLNEPAGTVKWRYYKSIHTIKLLLGNLSMFIITFIIGLKTLFSKKRSNIANQQMAKDEVIEENEEITQDEEKKSLGTESQESLKDELSNKTEENTKQETVIQEQPQTDVINYYGIGFLGISVIFFILTITFTIFFTKYQLKRKKKTSK
ncbi:MAG: sigma-70 family RNA polymerase sigma factor [Clostridia bacterium]|jgi:RNA polymerase sigma factor (sigma-70 family)|nr:sigma-70 family RNA polymerase sigma factor [Clostridia bacterium]